MLLPKLPPVNLQTDFLTIVPFHTALLLIKELTPQQKKCSNRSMLIRFTGLTVSHTIPKKLA